MSTANIISPNELTTELIDRLLDLAGSIPLPENTSDDSLNMDVIQEKAFKEDLERKVKYKLTLGEFLLKARSNLDDVDLDELLKSIINNFELVLDKMGFDEFSVQRTSFDEIIYPSDQPATGEVPPSDLGVDDRITMAPPSQSFVSSTYDEDQDEDDRSSGGGDEIEVSSVPPGGALGGKKVDATDQF
jgi:hypothetical protein